MPKGVRLGGRPKGGLNKVTVDVRKAIAEFAQANVDKMTIWLDSIDDPARKMDLYLRALEYHVPRLARSEHTGEGGGPIQVNVAAREIGL